MLLEKDMNFPNVGKHNIFLNFYWYNGFLFLTYMLEMALQQWRL